MTIRPDRVMDDGIETELIPLTDSGNHTLSTTGTFLHAKLGRNLR
jgi:hypothetical protein